MVHLAEAGEDLGKVVQQADVVEVACRHFRYLVLYYTKLFINEYKHYSLVFLRNVVFAFFQDTNLVHLILKRICFYSFRVASCCGWSPETRQSAFYPAAYQTFSVENLISLYWPTAVCVVVHISPF